MTTQLLERPAFRPETETDIRNNPESTAITADSAAVKLSIESELSTLANPGAELIDAKDQLGQRIMQSAMAPERGSFAVKCRSVAHATDFATPIRSMLLTLTSGFGGINVTISPSLNLNTWPAMDALVAALEESGAGELWQPIDERSVGIGAARHLFVSVDHPIRDESTSVFPNALVEVVGAHLIDPEWFDRIVAPRCRDEALTFVFYGQSGFTGSLFERAWLESQFRGTV